MRVGNFGITFEGGRELDNNYIAVKDGGQYVPVLRNFDHRRCDCVLTIDGKEIETFRLGAHASLRVEGPPDDPSKGRFTFFQSGTDGATLADEKSVSKDDKGLITAVFKPEKRRQPDLSDTINDLVKRSKKGQWPVKPTGLGSWTSGIPQLHGSVDEMSLSCASAEKSVDVDKAFNALDDERNTPLRGLKPGVTGLSGHTDRTWTAAYPIEYDESAFVTIHVRLVVAADGPRPLAAKGRTTPVPPPVE